MWETLDTSLEAPVESIVSEWLLNYKNFGSSPLLDLQDEFRFSENNALSENFEALSNQLLDILEQQYPEYISSGNYAVEWPYIFITSSSGDTLIFEYDSAHSSIILKDISFVDALGNITELEQDTILELGHSLRQLTAVLQAMEQVFDENTWWVSSYGYINEDDTYEVNNTEFPWSEIAWKDIIWISDDRVEITLVELQKIAQSLYQWLEVERAHIWDADISSLNEWFQSVQETYLDYVVGIWAKYEWGSRAFHSDEDGNENVSQGEIQSIIESLIASKSVDECFVYMLQKHREIEANNYKSTETDRTYKLWCDTLNKSVLEKLKQEQSSDKEFLYYAKLVSGRDVPELINTLNEERETQLPRLHSLDTKLFDPESATDAILYVFHREGWVFSKIEDKITIEDPKVSESVACSELVQNTVALITSRVDSQTDSDIARGTLLNAWFVSVLNLGPEVKYADLPLDQKMMISILVRLSEKLAQQDEVIDGVAFWNLFLEIAEDGQQAVIDGLNDNFDGWFLWFNSQDSSDVWLEWLDAEIFDLYNDIWWNGGLFDPSDFSIEWMRTWAVFWISIIATIAIAMAMAPVTIPALTALWLWTLSAEVTAAALIWVGVSRLAVPESFDNPQDFAKDLLTDIVFAVGFWLVGWVFTQRSWDIFTASRINSNMTWVRNYLSQAIQSSEWRRHMVRLWTDLWLLWVATEIFRNFSLRNDHLELPIVWVDIGITGITDVTDITTLEPIEAQSRFSAADFHEYVRLNIDAYLPEAWLSSPEE